MNRLMIFFMIGVFMVSIAFSIDYASYLKPDLSGMLASNESSMNQTQGENNTVQSEAASKQSTTGCIYQIKLDDYGLKKTVRTDNKCEDNAIIGYKKMSEVDNTCAYRSDPNMYNVSDNMTVIKNPTLGCPSELTVALMRIDVANQTGAVGTKTNESMDQTTPEMTKTPKTNATSEGIGTGKNQTGKNASSDKVGRNITEKPSTGNTSNATFTDASPEELATPDAGSNNESLVTIKNNTKNVTDRLPNATGTNTRRSKLPEATSMASLTTVAVITLVIVGFLIYLIVSGARRKP